MPEENKNALMENIEHTWDIFYMEAARFIKEGAPIRFDETKKGEYIKVFIRHYNTIMDAFMIDTPELDAHKQAAIVMISCLESQAVIVVEEPDEGTINILPQIIAVNIGLSFMNNALNALLDKMNKEKISRYFLPIPFACNTPYYEIMCRLLYYEQNRSDISFNVLEMADRLFLLDYINLLRNDINPLDFKKVIQGN